jgi:hypothetical protein
MLTVAAKHRPLGMPDLSSRRAINMQNRLAGSAYPGISGLAGYGSSRLPGENTIASGLTPWEPPVLDDQPLNRRPGFI